MSNDLLVAMTLVSAIGSAMVAGVFFAFSAFVMKGLGQLPAAKGIVAMQAINRAAPTPPFMTALFGTAVPSVALAVTSIFNWKMPYAMYLLGGGALYLLGPIAITIVHHVPRNDTLANLDPGAPSAEDEWLRYFRAWTAWNHLRAIAALASAVAFSIALRL